MDIVATLQVNYPTADVDSGTCHGLMMTIVTINFAAVERGLLAAQQVGFPTSRSTKGKEVKHNAYVRTPHHEGVFVEKTGLGQHGPNDLIVLFGKQ